MGLKPKILLLELLANELKHPSQTPTTMTHYPKTSLWDTLLEMPSSESTHTATVDKEARAWTRTLGPMSQSKDTKISADP